MPVGPGNFWNNMLSTILLLVFITAAFSYLTDTSKKPEQLSISDVVGQVKNGEVKEIIVKGAMLEVTYKDATKNAGEAKRETDASVSDSLSKLGVTPDQMANIKIDVQRETGFTYYLGQFAPFLFPLLFLGIIIWFLTRSVKGAGMQALSFAANWISRRNRSAPSVSPISALSTLIATSRSCLMSCARYTVAMPPAPSSRSMR